MHTYYYDYNYVTVYPKMGHFALGLRSDWSALMRAHMIISKLYTIP